MYMQSSEMFSAQKWWSFTHEFAIDFNSGLIAPALLIREVTLKSWEKKKRPTEKGKSINIPINVIPLSSLIKNVFSHIKLPLNRIFSDRNHYFKPANLAKALVKSNPTTYPTID